MPLVQAIRKGTPLLVQSDTEPLRPQPGSFEGLGSISKNPSRRGQAVLEPKDRPSLDLPDKAEWVPAGAVMSLGVRVQTRHRPRRRRAP
jgi:hypothetical protein